MKILCLADLHIGETQLQKALIGELTGHLLEIQALSLSENPDVIIAVDTEDWIFKRHNIQRRTA